MILDLQLPRLDGFAVLETGPRAVNGSARCWSSLTPLVFIIEDIPGSPELLVTFLAPNGYAVQTAL